MVGPFAGQCGDAGGSETSEVAPPALLRHEMRVVLHELRQWN